MTRFGPDMAVGGEFGQHTQFGDARYIARWNGFILKPLGSGTEGPVFAVESFTQEAPPFATELIAGGDFRAAGGVHAHSIARWIEGPGAGVGAWAPMGSGFDGPVYAIKRHNGSTYAAGAFSHSGSTAVGRIARWDEESGTWQPLGYGLNGTVFALASYGGSLYAGGTFTLAGGVPAPYVARWNGSDWRKVGPPHVDQLQVLPGSAVFALAVHDGVLRIGGSFTYEDSQDETVVANIIGLSSAGWSLMGSADGPVRALASSPVGLYAGGDFQNIGGLGGEVRVASWDGSWHHVQGGADGTVRALVSYHDEVHAGGEFQMVDSFTSPGWAKYFETGVPWIAQQPQSAEQPCKASFTVFMQAATGYSLQRQWRKDGVPLVNGPTGTGSYIIATGLLFVFNASDADEGVYDCVLSSACGSVTSEPVTLTITGDCPACIGNIFLLDDSTNVLNVGDLLALLSRWGPCPAFPGNCGADIAPPGGDGTVDHGDLLALLAGWGACP